MAFAVRAIALFELYHAFTEYQLIAFAMAFLKLERINQTFFIIFVTISIVSFLLILYCEYKFIQYI